MGAIASMLCTVVGFAYPIYGSYKALETEDKDDDTQWLVYWVVYAFFGLFEAVADAVVFWMPFYYEIKLVFLIALQLPQFKLAQKLYTGYIRPLYMNYGGFIDGFVNTVLEGLKGGVHSAPTPVNERQEKKEKKQE